MATPVALGDVNENSIQQNTSNDENVLPVNTNTPKSNNMNDESSSRIDPSPSKQSPLTPNNSSTMAQNPTTPMDTSLENPRLTRMMEKFDELQKSTPNTSLNETSTSVDSNDPEILRTEKQIYEVMSANLSQQGIEVEELLNSYPSHELFADIEQFRTSENHIEPENTTDPISSETSESQQVYEKRILHLMNKVSELESEKDELRAEKDDLRSKLNVQHEQDVQDMYQDPYSNPFATPTKATGGMPSFLQAATNNLSQQQQSAPSIAPTAPLATTTTHRQR